MNKKPKVFEKAISAKFKPDEREFLDKEAQNEQTSVSQIVRKAVKEYRLRKEKESELK